MINAIPITKNLRYLPIKPVKVSDKFFVQNIEPNGTYRYYMFKLSNPNEYAEMGCFKPKYDKHANLFITLIIASPRKKGLGTEMMNFAQKVSKKMGCEGRISLQASTMFTPEEIPHIFYRKLGFTTKNKKTDKKLDKFIKNKKNANHIDFKDMYMFYEPEETRIAQKNKISFLEKIKNIFSF